MVKGTLADANSKVAVTVEVSNTGKVAGEEIAQLYIRDNISSVTRPVKELKSYQRVALEPGETKTITFTLDAAAFAFYDRNMNYGVEPGEFTLMTGASSNDKDLQKVKLVVEKAIRLEK